jgi:hypothetical protein
MSPCASITPFFIPETDANKDAQTVMPRSKMFGQNLFHVGRDTFGTEWFYSVLLMGFVA